MPEESAARPRRPALFERTGERFWDDPHIASQMLAAHLDPTTDAASRRPEFIQASAAWIASLVPPGASLVDLGCGPGLYGRELSGLGLRVTGVDLSSNSIRYARAHDPAGDYRVLNYLTTPLPGIHEIATLIWCDYGALTPDERRVLLRRVAAALAPGGLFVLDVFTPAWLRGHAETTTDEDHPDGGFFSPLPHRCLSSTCHYDGRVSVDQYLVIDQTGSRRHNIWNTCFTPEELTAELAASGFAVVGTYDDVRGSPYTGSSDTLAAVARPEPA